MLSRLNPNVLMVEDDAASGGTRRGLSDWAKELDEAFAHKTIENCENFLGVSLDQREDDSPETDEPFVPKCMDLVGHRPSCPLPECEGSMYPRRTDILWTCRACSKQIPGVIFYRVVCSVCKLELCEGCTRSYLAQNQPEDMSRISLHETPDSILISREDDLQEETTPDATLASDTPRPNDSSLEVGSVVVDFSATQMMESPHGIRPSRSPDTTTHHQLSSLAPSASEYEQQILSALECPECDKSMMFTTTAQGGYVNGFACDPCGRSSNHNFSNRMNRVYCIKCHYDMCPECFCLLVGKGKESFSLTDDGAIMHNGNSIYQVERDKEGIVSVMYQECLDETAAVEVFLSSISSSTSTTMQNLYGYFNFGIILGSMILCHVLLAFLRSVVALSSQDDFTDEMWGVEVLSIFEFCHWILVYSLAIFSFASVVGICCDCGGSEWGCGGYDCRNILLVGGPVLICLIWFPVSLTIFILLVVTAQNGPASLNSYAIGFAVVGWINPILAIVVGILVFYLVRRCCGKELLQDSDGSESSNTARLCPRSCFLPLWNLVRKNELKQKNCMRELAEDFVRNHIGLEDVWFDPNAVVCYCARCFYLRNETPLLEQGGRKYSAPRLWVRFGLPPSRRYVPFRQDSWHVAFHGTSSVSAKAIVRSQSLLIPGDVLPDGSVLTIVPGHITDEQFSKHIFMSPSVVYISAPVYCREEVYKGKRFIVALELLINPESEYDRRGETLGADDRQIDPLHPNETIEWMTNRRGVTEVNAVLVRCLDELSEAVAWNETWKKLTKLGQLSADGTMPIRMGAREDGTLGMIVDETIWSDNATGSSQQEQHMNWNEENGMNE